MEATLECESVRPGPDVVVLGWGRSHMDLKHAKDMAVDQGSDMEQRPEQPKEDLVKMIVAEGLPKVPEEKVESFSVSCQNF